MELVLPVVTALSLGLALILGIAVVRLSRAERNRSAARVASLSAAAAEPEPMREIATSVAAEFLSEPVAVGKEPRVAPWASARVSAFSSSPRAVPTSPSRHATADELPLQSMTVGDGFLGGAAASSASAGRQRGLAIAAVLLFVVATAGGYWMIFGERTTAAAGVGAAAPSTLELVSLRHERRGATLDVTGLVRNPVNGLAVGKLSAVVFLFDQQGGFLSSARAGVDYVTLAPGDESPFVISMPAPASVARYRVSFRTDAGVVPHIDRRGQEPVAAHAVSQQAPAR